jgi:hypothetical protein
MNLIGGSNSNPNTNAISGAIANSSSASGAGREGSSSPSFGQFSRPDFSSMANGSQDLYNNHYFGTSNVAGQVSGAVAETYARSDAGPGAALYSTNSSAVSASESSALANRTFNPNSPDVDFRVDPRIYDSFDKLPDEFFGGKQGIEGYYGQDSQGGGFNGMGRGGSKDHMSPRELELYGNGQQALREGQTSFADGYNYVNPPADTALNGVINNQTELANLYNGVRSKIGGLFSDDAHMNQAINYSIDKLGTEYQDLAKNDDTLALVTGLNISKHGIQDSGFGDVMRSYADVANNIPTGLMNAAWANAYEQAGGGLEGLKAAAQVGTKDYGYMEISNSKVKSITHDINTTMFNQIADSAGFDRASLETEHKANGFNKQDSNYQLSGAYLASAAAASQLTKVDANGKNGFEKIVEQSQAAHEGRDTNGSDDGLYNASLNIYIVNDPSADGSAFASTEEGLTGLAGLMPFTSGLSDNPLNPNAFNLAFQGDSVQAQKKIEEFMTKAKEAGINFTNVNLKYKGHGGEDGHTLLKEGIVEKQNNFGAKDAEQIGSVISKHVGDGAHVDVVADSCFGKRSSQRIADNISQSAAAQGKNLKVTDSGSVIEGLVKSHQVHTTDNGFDRLVRNADGAVVSNRTRVDHANKTDERYSLGKESFAQVANKKAGENQQLFADFDARVNGNSDLASSKSDFSFTNTRLSQNSNNSEANQNWFKFGAAQERSQSGNHNSRIQEREEDKERAVTV